MKFKTVAFLSIASILISLTAFCLSYINVKGDASILVSVLAVLCTVLIGWQIFSIIDLNKIDKRFAELKADMESKFKTANKISDGFHGLAFHELSSLNETLRIANQSYSEIFLYRQLSTMLIEAESYIFTGLSNELDRLNNDIEVLIQEGISLPLKFSEDLGVALQRFLTRVHSRSDIDSSKFADALERFVSLYSSFCNQNHRKA